MLEVRLATWVTRLIVKVALHRIPISTPITQDSRVVFVCYPSIDIMFMHFIVGKFLQKISRDRITVQLFSEIYKIPLFNPNFYFFDAPKMPLSYEEKIAYLIRKSEGDPNIARGMIDQYRRMCLKEEFNQLTKFNFEVLKEISDALARAKFIVNDCDVLVITDLSYTFNRAANAFMRKKGGKVFILSAEGRFLEPEWEDGFAFDMRSTSSLLSEFDALGEPDRAILLKKTTDYAKCRFSGRSTDKDSQLAFQNVGFKKGIASPRLTVFLHCIRDASNDNPYDFPGSEDYFLWTKEMVRLISENQLSWKLKLHPNRIQYPDEDYIIEELLASHALGWDDLISHVPTSQILFDQTLAVTFSGTIALETAVRGFKSICFGNRYSKEFCKITDFGSIISDSREKISFYKLSTSVTERASIVMYGISREAQVAFDLSLNEPVQPNSSGKFRKITYLSQLLELLKKSGNVQFVSSLKLVAASLASIKIQNESRD